MLVLLLQPNQGCSRLESLYYISNTIPHIVGRLYEFIDTVSCWLAEHKKAYPNPSCSKYSGSRPREPSSENDWDGYAISAYLIPKVSLSFVGRQLELQTLVIRYVSYYQQNMLRLASDHPLSDYRAQPDA